MYHDQSQFSNAYYENAQVDFGALDQEVFASSHLRLVAHEQAHGDAGLGAGSGNSRDFTAHVRSRLATIGATIWVRYGGPCTDDDAIVYFETAMPFLVELAILEGRGDRVQSVSWASRNAPSLIGGTDGRSVLPDDNDRAWFLKQESHAIRARHDYARGHQGRANLPDGHELAVGLAIRTDEMRAGPIRGVTPIDRTAEQLADDRRAADLSRKQATRKPQESSPSRLEVWKRIGISKRTYQNRKAAGRLPEWPKIPRGADPEPYVTAWVALYRAMHHCDAKSEARSLAA